MSDKYEVGALVGQGSFGSVIMVRRRSDGAKLVMKRLPLSLAGAREMDAYHTELRLLSELEHPGVVGYVESFVDTRDMQLCIVMRFCDGGDLAQFIRTRASMQPQAAQGGAGAARGSKASASAASSSSGGGRLSESSILYHFVQMALALHFMHEKNILHRDLKAGNVFLRAGMLQLGDFGISKVLDKTADMASTIIGTPYYLSPELFKNKPYNHKSDVWALGCILYELTELRHAFEASNLSGLATKVIAGVYPPIAASYSRDLRELIASMLGATPASRPSVKQILLLPALLKSIKKYVRSVLVGSASDEAEFRPAHLVNLRNQLDRLGPPLSNLFAEVERERNEKKGAAAGSGKSGATAASKSRVAVAPFVSAHAAASGSGSVQDGSDDVIERTLVQGNRPSLPPGAAAAARDDSHPPTVRRSRRAPRHTEHGGAPPHGDAASVAEHHAARSSDAEAAPASRFGMQSRLAALDREHALRLEELRLEEEARSKLQQDFERLQALQAQRAQRLQARKAQLHAEVVDARPILAPNASIASTVSNSSTAGSGSNLPIIAPIAVKDLSAAAMLHAAQAPGPVVHSPQSPPLPALNVQIGVGHSAAPLQQHSSRNSSRHVSPALQPARLGKGQGRMPGILLPSGAVAVQPGHAPPSIARSASPGIGAPHAPPPPSTSPTNGAVSGGGAPGSAAPSPRFLSRRLAAANSSASADSGSPRGIASASSSGEAPPPVHGSASGADDKLKLLKRKAALRASPHTDSSAHAADSSAPPVSSSAPLPPSSTRARLPGRPRNAQRIVVPAAGQVGTAAGSAAAGASPQSALSPGSVLSPGSALEAELAAERVELTRLREERERLEELLTRMDDELFAQQPNAAAIVAPLSVPPPEVDTPTHGSSSAPPPSLNRPHSHHPVVHSPQGAAATTSPTFSASTLLPSAFDAPLQYKPRAAAASQAPQLHPPAGSNPVRSRRHSANVPVDAVAASAAHSNSNPAPRHRTMVGNLGALQLGAEAASANVSTRDRILAQKAAAKSEQSTAEAARLLAARKEYFADRQKADARTKGFYGNAPPTQHGQGRDPSPSSPEAHAAQRNHQPPLVIHAPGALHLHLNASLTPPSTMDDPYTRGIGADSVSSSLAREEAELASTHEDVAEFQHHLAQYTRRIETLRSQLSVATQIRGNMHAQQQQDDDEAEGSPMSGDFESASSDEEEYAAPVRANSRPPSGERVGASAWRGR